MIKGKGAASKLDIILTLNASLSTVVPAVNAMPQFLRENKQADLTDPTRIPWHQAHDTTDSIFKWLGERPEVLKSFMGWMAGQRDGLPTFLDVVDFESEFAKGADGSTPIFVDVGGSMGHQCIAVRQKYPNLAGRVVLQDLPETIEKVKATPLSGFDSIEALEHDFFTPQPLRGAPLPSLPIPFLSLAAIHDFSRQHELTRLNIGARAYYFRNVLHDWPADKCVEILRNIVPAMTAESRILIDEMVLPENGAPWRATQQDFIMGTVSNPYPLFVSFIIKTPFSSPWPLAYVGSVQARTRVLSAIVGPKIPLWSDD